MRAVTACVLVPLSVPGAASDGRLGSRLVQSGWFLGALRALPGRGLRGRFWACVRVRDGQ